MSIKKGIILAGGHGTRLAPLTDITNKQLLPVYNKPMVQYPLETLIKRGIHDILIISDGKHTGHFTDYLGDGSDFGVNLTYKVQKEAGGIAQALGLAKDFAAGDSVTVILGDNIFEDKYIPTFKIEEDKAYFFVKKVKNPERFGVISLSEVGQEGDPIIVEKPKRPVGDQAVVGLYIYPNDVFDIIPTLKPSERGELEITDVNNFYLKRQRGCIKKIKGFWTDMGSHDSLLESAKWVKKKIKLDEKK